MLAVGLLSGTSLDGIDAVLCEVKGKGKKTEVKQLAFESYALPENIQKKVEKCAANEAVKLSTLTSLNFELGALFGEAVLDLCKSYGIDSKELDFVASHGQTLYHQPNKSDEYLPSTLQMGESAVIAAKCHCPVVSDFRVMDMAVGGQGAPLVPYSEYILYQDTTKNIALQNIGGIGNMTILPAGLETNNIQAFDTGPGNMMIDTAMKILFDKSYDESGKVAASGKLIPALQEELKSHPYLRKSLPKTTGREDFGKHLTEKILNEYAEEKPEDIITTLTWFTAYCIAYHYQELLKPEFSLNQIVVGGGGSHNLTLLNYMSELMPELSVLTQEDLGYSSDAKEAIAFVILGNESLHQESSNIPTATHAEREVVLGKIQYVKKEKITEDSKKGLRQK
ncbi:MAG: anhydro-N-acetylmuramic acid kinase [Atopostipes suicloacalis]|nr:anhydro-N-acetylmuramic acid kinase [Atopostipes suicloacalis]